VERADEEQEAGGIPMPAAAPATILVVDDEELVRAATGEMLRALGYDVIEAASGAEAMRCLRQHEEIDLVVTDHIMPGMTGAMLARDVAARNPALPVLIITGYADPHALPPEQPNLRKPFRSEQLATAVAGLLKGPTDNVVRFTGRPRGSRPPRPRS